MHLGISLDKDFEELFMKLKHKYPEMIRIEGLSNEQLDPMRFFKNFLKSNNVANVSIDDNSNVNSQNMPTLLDEARKPLLKLMSFNKIFIEMKESFGLKDAKEYFIKHLKSDIFQHDSSLTSYQPYCFAYSLKPIAENGLFFIKEMKANSPKHLDTFNSHYLEFCAFATNQQSGSVGTPDYLLWSYYFWKKDVENNYIPDNKKYKIMEQEFQKVIYSLNQPWMKISQSAYTNWSIMDREYYVGLFGDLIFPDSSFAIDFIDDFMDYQKRFLNFINTERHKKSFTFPVLSLSCIFKDGEFKDEDMVKYVVRHNMQWADVNIYKSENPDALSSCCFDENQSCLTKSTNGVNLMSFKDLYEGSHNEYKTNFKIFNNGNWMAGNVVKIPRDNKKMYKVITSNNKELFMTEDHINFTFNGDKYTKDLKLDDYIGFNNVASDPIKERDMKLTYEQGVVIGAYLGDGSNSNNCNTRVFSINKDKYTILKPIIDKAIIQLGIEDKELLLGKIYNNVYPCRVVDETFEEFISFWVQGNYCYEKRLNLEAILQSKEFRQGIIDGMYITDGGNSNRIYSTSYGMIEDLEAVMTSLGIISIIDTSDRTGEGKVIIRGQEFNRNYPVHCIRFYKHDYNRTMKNVYKKKNNTIFFKIKTIEEIKDYDKDYVYCFEMKDQTDPYFTLPNGVHTHNCRAEFNSSDLEENKKLEGNFNSIGGSDLNIGSSKVVTINFPRIGYEAKGDFNKAKEMIKQNVLLIQKFHKVHRDILKKNVDRGLLPLFEHKLISFNKLFATIGISGFEEYIEQMNGISKNKIGEKYYNDFGIKIAKETLEFINDLGKDTNYKYGYTQNVEQIPNTLNLGM